ncbi:MAG: AAA family ATPase, partial [Deltaproteobacteria bacterium]|nr:AAA family ATPase [Deltaproteobacteria bacterium]
MRLKQLEVIGFKSFAHRTVLDFPSGITAVVGPNGCGKSNVVDAIRWVLGEQSPRHLRGESMEDVIFKGNDSVAPLGMAQVSLTFENDSSIAQQTDLDLELSTLPAHLRDQSEITISRRYFRSGESEYLINKIACRLKDITELFLGTGVGTKAYAIIEQGRVEQLINAKPEDRRLFIEEAAGTTLYRSRKLAAERKMERTRENLLRVNDVLRELDRQIQYLHRLAKKAEQYRNLREEARQLDLGLSAIRWRRLSEALAELEQDLATASADEAAAVDRLAELEGQLGEKRAAVTVAEEHLAQWREAAARLSAECESLQQRIDLRNRELVERERRLDRLATEISEIDGGQIELHQRLESAEHARQQWAENLHQANEELAVKEREVAAARTSAASLQETVEARKGDILGVVAREAELR